ncbi:hypothetical protein LCGC14_0694290 [marine sediment metagenome]|uniref:HNH nuclease domain-containing protein n=1 Tax=marine sediment metagenome TaxID=412755 RepID=A0A0F9R4X6_9ZZZZ
MADGKTFILGCVVGGTVVSLGKWLFAYWRESGKTSTGIIMKVMEKYFEYPRQDGDEEFDDDSDCGDEKVRYMLDEEYNIVISVKEIEDALKEEDLTPCKVCKFIQNYVLGRKTIVIMKIMEKDLDYTRRGDGGDGDYGKAWYMLDEEYNITVTACTIEDVLREEELTPFKVDKFIRNYIKRMETFRRGEALELKKSKLYQKDEKLVVEQEAERRVYGEVKSKRAPLTPEERKTVHDKYHNECAVCSGTVGLEIHHRDDDATNNRLGNLILLCVDCHKETRKKSKTNTRKKKK